MTDVGTIPLMSDEHKNITQTINNYSKRLFSFIKGKVASNEDAEDILQEVFYQLAGNAKPVEQLTAWLFTIARNKITDSYRKKKPELLDDIFFNGEEDDIGWKEILFSEDADPETEYVRSIFWATLNEALNELPQEQREAFVQHELNDISFDEMSKRSGVSVATLTSRKRYAILHLRKRLEIVKNELLNF